MPTILAGDARPWPCQSGAIRHYWGPLDTWC
nr:MAG TPA_asm: hypothetical protein [Caudoviricetes sp.]